MVLYSLNEIQRAEDGEAAGDDPRHADHIRDTFLPGRVTWGLQLRLAKCGLPRYKRDMITCNLFGQLETLSHSNLLSS
jgi:hypothetical protein